MQKIGAENAIAVKANVGDVREIERLVKETVDKWGKIDILAANAGVAIWYGACSAHRMFR